MIAVALSWLPIPAAAAIGLAVLHAIRRWGPDYDDVTDDPVYPGSAAEALAIGLEAERLAEAEADDEEGA